MQEMYVSVQILRLEKNLDFSSEAIRSVELHVSVNCSSQVSMYRSNRNLEDKGKHASSDSWPTSDWVSQLSEEGLDDIQRELDSGVMTVKETSAEEFRAATNSHFHHWFICQF